MTARPPFIRTNLTTPGSVLSGQRLGWSIFAGCFLLLLTSGCMSTVKSTPLPSQQKLIRDQLVIHSDFRISKKHRLIEDLTARRTDIAKLLKLSVSDEPIHVYLFEDEPRYRTFLKANHPHFPDRRAFFVKTDTDLTVYAYWGERVAEDLRHEVTHGYLHSIVPSLPFWLDEGLAEYFETPRGENGLHQTHVFLLTHQFRAGDWTPDLVSLELQSSSENFDQTQYAEAWLWMHFLIHHSDETRQLLTRYLGQLEESPDSNPISERLSESIGDPQTAVLAHLRKLAKGM